MNITKHIKSRFPIVLVDTSYVSFYGLHATELWFKFAHKELEPPENDWTEYELFTDKYTEMYMKRFGNMFKKKAVKDLLNTKIKPVINVFTGKPKKVRSKGPLIPYNQFICAMDCPRHKIWRTSDFKTYKANRDKTYKSKKWKGSGILRYAHTTLVPELAKRHNFIVAKEPKLEGDDVIALFHRYVRKVSPMKEIVIITNDHDMLQLIDNNTTIINLKGQYLNNKAVGSGEENLLMKVLCGDPSDNIKSAFPKCGKKTALKMIEDRVALEHKLNSNPTYRDNYEFNRKMIDFNCIPQDLVDNFINKIEIK
jgi:5'-3' exonuclease